MAMARKIERISTCERMLNDGVLQQGGAGSEILKNLLKDDSDDEYEDYCFQNDGAVLTD